MGDNWEIYASWNQPLGLSEDKQNPLPSQFSLSQNYPNPFNSTTLIHYTIPQVIGERSKVEGGPNTSHLKPITLKVYNILGQEVRTLVAGEQRAGNYQVKWEGKDNFSQDVSSGIYLYRLAVKGDRSWVTRTRKTVLLR